MHRKGSSNVIHAPYPFFLFLPMTSSPRSITRVMLIDLLPSRVTEEEVSQNLFRFMPRRHLTYFLYLTPNPSLRKPCMCNLMNHPMGYRQEQRNSIVKRYSDFYSIRYSNVFVVSRHDSAETKDVSETPAKRLLIFASYAHHNTSTSEVLYFLYT